MNPCDRVSAVRIRVAKPWLAATGRVRSPAAWPALLALLGGCVVPAIQPLLAPLSPSYVTSAPPAPPPPPSYAAPAPAPPPPSYAAPAPAPPPSDVAPAPPAAGIAVTAQATASTGGDMIAVDDPPPGDAAPTIESFYQPLAAYGHWGQHPQYGAVWNPGDPSYEPYANGYWQASTYGWVWIPNEPFGWAVNHYGRWLWDGAWYWVPDTTWGPSWVDWRVGGDYIGWAPAVPAGAAALPAARWKFIAAEDMGRVDLPNAYVALDPDAVFDASQPVLRYTRAPQGEVFVAGPDPVVLRERYAVDVTPVPLPAAVSGRFTPQAWHDPSAVDREWRVASLRQRQQSQQRLDTRRRPAASLPSDTPRRQLQPPGGVDGRPTDPRAQTRALSPDRQRSPQPSRTGPPPRPQQQQPQPQPPRQIQRDPRGSPPARAQSAPQQPQQRVPHPVLSPPSPPKKK
jgi:hypothetical protein